MARITDLERTLKKNKARDYYLKNSFSLSHIAELVSVKTDTLKDWIEDERWDKLKTKTITHPKHIQQMILKCAEDIFYDRPPKHSPDELAKLVSAYEKLDTDMFREMYFMEAFSLMMNLMQDKMKEERDIDKRGELIERSKYLGELTEELLIKETSYEEKTEND